MDNNAISVEKAKELLENGAAQAQELLSDPSKIDDLLAQLEQKLKEVPALGTTLSEIPLMISMVKSYITREYSEVSPKVIVSIVSALLYIIKKNDLIADDIPVVGIVDDIAVVTLALKFVEPELRAYAAWRDGRKDAEV